jgi:hypothetical protein
MARVAIRPYTKSWDFNGSSSSGTNASLTLAAFDRLSVDFWIHIHSPSAGQILLETSAFWFTNANSFVIYTDASGIVAGQSFNSSTGSRWATGVAYRPIGKWLHVCAVFDRTLAQNVATKVYVDGVVRGANDLATGTGGSATFADRPVYVGARAGTSVWFNGHMKDLRICSFPSSFAAADAVTLYKDDRTPAGFTERFRWGGEDSAGTAVDSVGGANLTLSNVSYTAGHTPTAARTSATARSAATARTAATARSAA